MSMPGAGVCVVCARMFNVCVLVCLGVYTMKLRSVWGMR